jgi:hypothetical protein
LPLFGGVFFRLGCLQLAAALEEPLLMALDCGQLTARLGKLLLSVASDRKTPFELVRCSRFQLLQALLFAQLLGLVRRSLHEILDQCCSLQGTRYLALLFGGKARLQRFPSGLQICHSGFCVIHGNQIGHEFLF